MNADQKDQLHHNIAEAMAGVPDRIKARQLVHFYKADPAYGRGVAKLVGMDMEKLIPWTMLSLSDLFDKTSAANYK